MILNATELVFIWLQALSWIIHDILKILYLSRQNSFTEMQNILRALDSLTSLRKL